MTALDRLRHLARHTTFEPDRGFTSDDGPEPFRGQAREIPARIRGARLFIATDKDGEVSGFGLMEPGGNITLIDIGLFASMEQDERRQLRAV